MRGRGRFGDAGHTCGTDEAEARSSAPDARGPFEPESGRSGLGSKRVPDSSELEGKACNRSLSGEGFDFAQQFWIMAGSVDLNGARLRIKQPAELRAVNDVFAHLFPQDGQPVRFGAELDHERWTEMPVAFKIL